MKRLMSNAGMTLIEIMVVLAIIGVIGTIVTVNVMDSLDQAKVETAMTQMRNLESALDAYRRDNGVYPSTEQGLKALVEKPSIGRTPKRYPKNGYLKGGKVPSDPFNCEYIYYSPGIYGHDYEILSLGKDCQEGGEDTDADIKSWELVE